jgi:hypothetical protein
MAELRKRVPAGSLLLTDFRTQNVLAYYLGRDELNNERAVFAGFWESNVGPYCAIRSWLWNPDATAFASQVEATAEAYRLRRGQRFWVVRLGSEYDAPVELRRRLARVWIPATVRVGDVSLIEVWPGEDSIMKAAEPRIAADSSRGQWAR